VLRRLAGLAGAQHDADKMIVEFTADEFHQVQASLVGLHHHIQQHHADIRRGAQNLAGLSGRVRVMELQWAIFEPEGAQHQTGHFVNGRFVIDDQHMPRLCCNGFSRKLEELVTLRHRRPANGPRNPKLRARRRHVNVFGEKLTIFPRI